MDEARTPEGAVDQAGWCGEKALAVLVGGAIQHQSVHIPLLHELSVTHGCNRMITL